jgi:hypothetical protein
MPVQDRDGFAGKVLVGVERERPELGAFHDVAQTVAQVAGC